MTDNCNCTLIGVTTGECTTNGTCQINGWCPPEDENDTLT